MRRSTMTSMFWPRLSALTASWNTSGRYTETMQSRGGMAVPLSGAGRPLGGAHLVIPDGAELHVVAVLADALLALGTGAHRDSSSSVGRLDERRIIQASGGPGARLHVLSHRRPSERGRRRLRGRRRARLQGHLSQGPR